MTGSPQRGVYRAEKLNESLINWTTVTYYGTIFVFRQPKRNRSIRSVQCMFQIKLSKFLVMYQLFCFLHLSPFRLFFVDSNKKKTASKLWTFLFFVWHFWKIYGFICLKRIEARKRERKSYKIKTETDCKWNVHC